MFAGRKLLITTKHEKEKVIAPILEKALGVTCCVPEDFDTDALGTFTGEIERPDTPLATAREKCRRALALTGGDLAVASEGSFGPHPSMYFVPAGDELLLLLDQQHNLEIVAREITLDTNYAGRAITTMEELTAFATAVGFPAHGLIARAAQADATALVKGITDWPTLHEVFARFRREHGALFLETDMRALFNPTRMATIAALTHKLVAQVRSCCPQCATPGFSITDRRPGLPCGWCGSPTDSTLSYRYTCRRCGFGQDHLYPDDKTTEDPGYCAHCNP